MSFKEIFRLTQGKIILAVIISFLAVYFGIFMVKLTAEIDRGIEVSELKFKTVQVTEIILALPVYLITGYTISIFFSGQISSYLSLGDILFIFVLFFLLVFYWYFLSCLIVLFCERLKIRLKQKTSRSSRDPYDY